MEGGAKAIPTFLQVHESSIYNDVIKVDGAAEAA
jgi:hypothetical protein